MAEWTDDLNTQFESKFTGLFGEFSSQENTGFPAADSGYNSFENGDDMAAAGPGASGGITSTAVSDARSSAASSSYNTWEQGDFNVGFGAGSNSMAILLIGVGLAGLIYILNRYKIK